MSALLREPISTTTSARSLHAMKTKRKTFFGVLYLLFGLVMLSLSLPLDRGGNAFALPIAILLFAASAGAFVSPGRWWRALHVALFGLTLYACFESWAYVLPFMRGTRHTVDWGGLGVLLILIAALLLTFALIAYAVDFAGWLRARSQPSPRTGNEVGR